VGRDSGYGYRRPGSSPVRRRGADESRVRARGVRAGRILVVASHHRAAPGAGGFRLSPCIIVWQASAVIDLLIVTHNISSPARPVALVTGVGRRVGIAAGICERLASDGWDLAVTYWAAYDDRQPWGRQPEDVRDICEQLLKGGAHVVGIEADLADSDAPKRLFSSATEQIGPITALVMAHCESVDSGIMDTTVESFDRHFAVNARAIWLLIREYAGRLRDRDGSGRIIALTSDHVAHNVPYGASKGALDRIVIAAARELAELRVTANVINPGPIDTGWMTDEIRRGVTAANPRGRLGTPADTAALVAFLCSSDGGWINGQLLHSDGGWKT